MHVGKCVETGLNDRSMYVSIDGAAFGVGRSRRPAMLTAKVTANEPDGCGARRMPADLSA
jgi:hypothetical protein